MRIFKILESPLNNNANTLKENLKYEKVNCNYNSLSNFIIKNNRNLKSDKPHAAIHKEIYCLNDNILLPACVII